MTQDRTWRTSTYSGGAEDGNCVEVSLAQNALVRDSKNASGHVLAFSSPAWQDLLRSLGSR
ncbi:DUF397 domain-containing protein [Lentzea flaviverrucosa]|uniref:DUF397 domain-containing protein n=1 Tax=Lentzea flaviverrucosa TaxID=200379 RepID=A0A1H9XX32_9PSEU|nr:DUF397 domain-containing protein [Lentzea flaviverrucosa]RDI18380.1 uncharacterized protein DUF397 [Lentzea flaviverrucosa]SES50317.1 protein of unknown function [Lentzea flaviverrucosa]